MTLEHDHLKQAGNDRLGHRQMSAFGCSAFETLNFWTDRQPEIEGV